MRNEWFDDVAMFDCNKTTLLWRFPKIGVPLNHFIEGSLEVKLPTRWTDEKQRWEESERREE